MNKLTHLLRPSILREDNRLQDSRLTRFEKMLLVLWVIFNLVIGSLTVHEYGMSIDEPNNYRYAADTLNAYPSLFGLFYEPNYDSSYDGHGPAFATLTGLFVRMVQAIDPDVFAPDLWHVSYFVTFLLTGICLYWLTRRWFSAWTAWGILALFGTQPLLLGHAFINPKDIPFMFFFTLSVALGFQMIDGVAGQPSFVSLERHISNLKHKFGASDRQHRRKFLRLLVLAAVIALAFIVWSHQIDALIREIVALFYNAEPDTWAGRLFNSVASHKAPLQDYVTKAMRIFARIEGRLLVAAALFFLMYFGLLINNLPLRVALRNISARLRSFATYPKNVLEVEGRSRPGTLGTAWFVDLLRALRNPRVAAAGIALGLATGVRAIGPLGGLIVGLYLIAKSRSGAWTTAIAYFFIAGIVTYLAWPRLWDAPISRYLEGLGLISNFPHFPGQVLFNGQLYGPSDLPRSYLPVLLSIQFTEPLVLGVYVGMVLFIWQLLVRRLPSDLLLFIGLGFVFPLLGLILLQSPLYHNFRQTLFLVPAMVMLAAFPLEFLFSKINRSWAGALLMVALVFPGVSSTLKLYPYEYVYYSSLVGGPAGAVHRYEMDYWRISLREMALELNKVATPEAIIVVTRSAGLFARYARPDLTVDKPINSILDLTTGYDYIVQVTRGEGGDLYPEVGNLVVIERDGAVLATAKYVKGLPGNRI